MFYALLPMQPIGHIPAVTEFDMQSMAWWCKESARKLNMTGFQIISKISLLEINIKIFLYLSTIPWRHRYIYTAHLTP
jgi:hypothetical protein